MVRTFAADLLRSLAPRVGNTVWSPWSIATALALARAGAADVTAEQMDAVLGVEGADAATSIGGLQRHLLGLAGPVRTAGGGDGELALRAANALWVQSGFGLDPRFLATVETDHGAGVRTVDFAGAVDTARSAINSWVAHATAGRIPDLIAPGVLDPLSRLVLTNAVHLLAPWHRPFADARTHPFSAPGGRTVKARLMDLTAALAYKREPGWQAVTLPYAGRTLAMTVVVPDAGGFDAVERAADLERWLAPAPERSVHLRLPRFAVEAGASLAPVLAGLGMPAAFDPDAADFSAMTTDEALHISAVEHRATITVDEQGTEAAAATAVVMAVRTSLVRPAPPLELIVDRPFLFVVHDVEHRAPLFTGRVLDPTA